MKNLKCIAAALSLAGFCFISKAQSPLKFGIGAEAGLPLGDESDVYSVVAGGSINASFQLIPKLQLTGSLGYQRWFGKSNLTYYELDEDFNVIEVDGKVPDASYIPLLVGAKFHFGPVVFPVYGKLEIGAVFNTKDEPGVNPVGLVLSPGIGVSFGKLDAQLKYELWNNNGYDVSFAAVKVVYFVF